MWLTVDKDGTECAWSRKPIRNEEKGMWVVATPDRELRNNLIDNFPIGSLEKLIGCSLTWADEPFEFTRR